MQQIVFLLIFAFRASDRGNRPMTVPSLKDQLRVIQERNRLVLGVQAGAKERPSFLFTPSQAADFDNDAIYALAQPAFHELCGEDRRLHILGSRFFETPKYGEDLSLETIKSIEDDLRPAVAAFLRALCVAHFTKPTAHQALEWMVRRWRVADMFAEELLCAMIMHHDTVPFVRMVQIMYFSETSQWLFVRDHVQREGKPMSRSFIARKLHSRPALQAALHSTAIACLDDVAEDSKVAVAAAKRYLSFYMFVTLEALQIAPVLDDTSAIRLFQHMYLLLSHEARLPDAVAAALALLLEICDRTTLSQRAIDACMDVLSTRLPCGELNAAVSAFLPKLLDKNGVTESSAINAVRSLVSQ